MVISPIMFVCTVSRINISPRLLALPASTHCTSMPPKRKIAAKRDDASTASDNESVSQSQSQAKRAKLTASTSEGVKAPNGQPTNKVLPVNIAFPPRTAGTLRFVTWNVCGLAAAQRKVRFRLDTIDCTWTRRTRVSGVQILCRGGRSGRPRVDGDKGERHVFVRCFFRVLDAPQVNNEPVDPVISARFPYRTWAISDKKTYGALISVTERVFSNLNPAGGTAVLSKIKPISVTKLLPGHPNPEQVKGRLITLEFEGCYVVCTYVTNAGQNLKVLQLVLPIAFSDKRW